MMKYRITLFFAILMVGTLQAQPPKDYHLVWSDEFSGTQIDTTSWSFETGDGGWGNNEKQYYTDGKNVDVRRGLLSIVVRKVGLKYTSARMVTKGKRIFKYGYMEIRAKIPAGLGTWPAIWMLGENITEKGWPACGELDIMEHVGKHPGYVHCSVHNLAGYGETPYTGIVQIEHLFDSFHTYSLEWTEDKISFAVDGKTVYRYTPERKTKENWPFDLPMFFIFNVAVGGNWGGPTIDDSVFPQKMTVDYIRVYQKK